MVWQDKTVPSSSSSSTHPLRRAAGMGKRRGHACMAQGRAGQGRTGQGEGCLGGMAGSHDGDRSSTARGRLGCAAAVTVVAASQAPTHLRATTPNIAARGGTYRMSRCRMTAGGGGGGGGKYGKTATFAVCGAITRGVVSEGVHMSGQKDGRPRTGGSGSAGGLT